jgi:hypothetical protein
MTANWRRCDGLQSTLAPTSSTTVRPDRLGNTAARAGRSTPASGPISMRAEITAAPVLPALTIASASPAATSSAQRRIDELGLRRIGVVAGSSMPTVSSACSTRMRSAAPPSRASSCSMRVPSPTSWMATPSPAASTAPRTTTAGA